MTIIGGGDGRCGRWALVRLDWLVSVIELKGCLWAASETHKLPPPIKHHTRHHHRHQWWWWSSDQAVNRVSCVDEHSFGPISYCPSPSAITMMAITWRTHIYCHHHHHHHHIAIWCIKTFGPLIKSNPAHNACRFTSSHFWLKQTKQKPCKWILKITIGGIKLSFAVCNDWAANKCNRLIQLGAHQERGISIFETNRAIRLVAFSWPLENQME